MIKRMFERYDGRQLAVFGYFTESEIRELKMNGYKQTWQEPTQYNKNGIRVDARKVVMK